MKGKAGEAAKARECLESRTLLQGIERERIRDRMVRK